MLSVFLLASLITSGSCAVIDHKGVSVEVGTNVFIDPSATISQNVTINDNSKIGANCLIKENAVIQSNVVLIGDVTVGTSSVIYSGVEIHNFTVIGDNNAIGKAKNQNAGVTATNVTHIGYYNTFKNDVRIEVGTKLGSYIAIGEKCEINSDVTIGDYVDINGFVILRNNVQIGDSCSIGEWSEINRGVVLHPKCKLGSGVTVGPDSQIGLEPIETGNRRKRTPATDADSAFSTVLDSDGNYGSRVLIHEGCHMGQWVVVAFGGKVMENVKFGYAVMLNTDVFVDENTTIGDRTTVASLCQIGKHTAIGEGSIIGYNVSMGQYSNIADDVALKENVHILANNTISQGTILGQNIEAKNNNAFGKNVRVGANSKIGSGNFFPDNYKLSANSVVENDTDLVPNDDDSSLGTGAIIGIAIGSAVFVLGFLCLFVYCCRRPTEKVRNKHKYKGPPIPDTLFDDFNKQSIDLLREWKDTEQLIPNNHIYKQEIIGSGAFGNVYRGVMYDRRRVCPIAIKEIKVINQSEEEVEKIFDEANIMKKLCHQNVVAYIGLNEVDEEEPRCILLEYMNLGDLQHYLRQTVENNEITTEDERVSYMKQLASGMLYLKTKGIVHRDLASRNCMLSTGNDSTFGFPLLKVSDFGLARVTEDNKEYYQMTSNEKLPVRWMAPESCRQYRFTEASDVWSYGVTLWEIYTNAKTPFAKLDLYEILRAIDSNCRLEKPKSCNDIIYDMMYSCWKINPEDRPSFMELNEQANEIFEQTKLDRIKRELRERDINDKKPGHTNQYSEIVSAFDTGSASERGSISDTDYNYHVYRNDCQEIREQQQQQQIQLRSLKEQEAHEHNQDPPNYGYSNEQQQQQFQPTPQLNDEDYDLDPYVRPCSKESIVSQNQYTNPRSKDSIKIQDSYSRKKLMEDP